MAGITHHRFGFVGRLEFTLAVYAEGLRRLLRGEPLAHGHSRRGGGVDERHGKTGQALHQQAHHLVGLFRAAGVDHQHFGLRVDPHTHAGEFGERLRQQRVADVFLDVAGFFLAGFAPGAGLDLRRLLFGLVVHHARRQQLGLDPELQDALAAHHLQQRAMLLATWLHPAKRAFCAHVAGHKTRRLQTGLHRLCRLFPSRRNPVHQ